MRGTGPEGPETSSRSFGLHVLDNLFRHRILFALPLLLFAALGINQTRSVYPEYESTAVVRVGANPNVGLLLVRGTNIQYRESAAEGTIRLIQEQLTTRRFASGLATRAALDEALAAGWIVFDDVRGSIEFESRGDTLMAITATWDDPETSFALVEGTIDSYASYLADTAAIDAEQAEQLYRSVLTEAQSVLTELESELTEYVGSLGPLTPEADRNIAETVEIERLENRIDRAALDVATAQQQVDSAVVANTLATADSARALVIEDAAKLPTGPVSTNLRDFQTIVAYIVMGVIVSGSALLVTSSVDQGFSVPTEVATMPGIEAVALARPVKQSFTAVWSRGRTQRDSGDVSSDDVGVLTSGRT